MSLGEGYGLPVDKSQQLENAVDITNALNNDVPMLVNPTTTANTAARAAIEAVELPEPEGDWTEEMRDATQTTLDDASSALTDLQNHTNGHMSNIGPRMGQFDSAKRLEQTMNPVPTENVCDQIMDFFGSILGGGGDLINAIAQQITNLLNLIAQGLTALAAGINAILTAIGDAIGAVLDMIASELAALANSLAQAARYALGSLLSAINSNSCLQLLVAAAGTAALIAILARQ